VTKETGAFLYHLFSFVQSINFKPKPCGIRAKPQIARISQMTEAEEVNTESKESYRNKKNSKTLTLPTLICVIHEICGLVFNSLVFNRCLDRKSHHQDRG
jgi:hypothetical protein